VNYFREVNWVTLPHSISGKLMGLFISGKFMDKFISGKFMENYISGKFMENYIYLFRGILWVFKTRLEIMGESEAKIGRIRAYRGLSVLL
jgi:hypothetical protein